MKKLLVGLVLSVAALLPAQETAESSPRNAPPLLPVMVRYRYMPRYFYQWMNGDPEYSTIRGWVDSKEAGASHCVALADTKTHKETFYCDGKSQAEGLKSRGQEVFVTPIDFKAAAEVSQGAAFYFAFRDKNGDPVQWRFIAAGELDERGSGLAPGSNAPGLQLAYREHGTVAASGSAVQVGKRVNEAEEWKEVSAPPFFVAYRGTYTEGMHVLDLFPAQEDWHVESSPDTVKPGAKWVLKSADGNLHTLTVQEASGSDLTIKQQDGSSAQILYSISSAPADGAALPKQIRFSDHGASATVSIARSGAFEIDMGKGHAIARGSITPSNTAGANTWKWQFKTPDWARGRTLETKLAPGQGAYVLSLTASK